jgi:sugar lactone lactonase YvrE
VERWVDPRPAWGFPAATLGLAEGVAFSPDGRVLAIAHAADQRVTLYARDGDDDPWSDRPRWVIQGEGSGVDYPHDVDFSPDGTRLVVANRQGRSVTCYARLPGDALRFSDRPIWTLRGRRSRLGYCDGVKFVPPAGDFLAAVDLKHDRVTLYARSAWFAGRFRRRPAHVLEGEETRLAKPDGLAFSPAGALLAVTNHGGGTVTVYARGARAPVYGPRPVAVIGAGRLRYPHSVAFSPDGDHLAVSDAGARTVCVWRREPGDDPAASRWPEAPAYEVEACDPATFEAKNRVEPKEGGPKGIAFGADSLAICSAGVGLRVHRVRGAPAAARG